ncbi:ferrichrome ABC transporter permease [Paenibacillus swuensis]|uniref:Ferrichrome ABC transporter permease n=1 Tax=Paenibacillus swuensis TaxID=1178515 RepID=A0A172TFC1_9BACL|nr:iron ABC transporter permease [Paenibacillus swuensis]ANE45604.1 ferrichrome ABC transporter permease [Paenibacillus swuensis]
MQGKESTTTGELTVKARPLAAMLILVGGLVALVLSMMTSIAVGAADIQLSTVWDAIVHANPDLTQHQIIRELRMPRAVIAALVGAGLAVAGAIIQGMTRNPLGDSGLLGLNAGAGLLLAICFAFAPGMSFLQLMLFAFLGAALGAGLVFGIGSLNKGGLTPFRLTMAGAAVGALLIALSEGIAILYRIGQDLAFWYAGGVAGVQWMHVSAVAPFIAVGLAGALMLSPSVTLLSLGEDVARGLGQRTMLVKCLGMLIVLILAGASVAVAGNIGFVGLVIPHVARLLVGSDYRWIIPCSGVLGALLIVISDIGARMINPPYETPIGALIALIGVPFFLYLTRRGGRGLQ